MKMSIRSLLIGMFAVLSLTLAATIAFSMVLSYRAYLRDDEVSTLTNLDKALFEALVAFRSERGDSASALKLKSSDAAGSIASVTKMRQIVDRGMTEADRVTSDITDSNVRQQYATVQATFEKVKTYRATIDSALANPLESRDASLIKTSMDLGATFLTDIETALLASEARIRTVDPATVPMMQIRASAWSTRALGGGASLLLNNVVTSPTAPDPQIASQLAIFDAKIDYAWKAVEMLVKHPQTPREIQDAFEDANRTYFAGSYAEIRNAVIAKITAGEKPSLTIDDWRAPTTASLFKIANVAILAMDTIDREATATKSAALSQFLTLLGLFAFSLATGVVAMGVIVYKVTKPLAALTHCMRALADGNLKITIPGVERGDEMGKMAQSVEVFQIAAVRNQELENNATANRLAAEQERETIRITAEAEAEDRLNRATGTLAASLRRLSTGDMQCEIKVPLAPQFENLRADFNTSVEKLRSALVSVDGSVVIVTNGSSEISEASDNLAKRTEQQAAALEETAAALEQITVNVAATSQLTVKARDVVRSARERADRSGVVVRDAVVAMQRIEDSSRQIEQIISVIDEIAFQTNLLALNAGVEAARAGEAGRGFAVVAQEVRELAQRSATAAREIKKLIVNSTSAVSQGVDLVGQTGEGLTEIEQLVQVINAHMDAIATAAGEQSSGLAEVNVAINHMDHATQQNAAMVEEMTAAGAGLAQESANLTNLLSYFVLPDRDAGMSAAPLRRRA